MGDTVEGLEYFFLDGFDRFEIFLGFDGIFDGFGVGISFFLQMVVRLCLDGVIKVRCSISFDAFFNATTIFLILNDPIHEVTNPRSICLIQILPIAIH